MILVRWEPFRDLAAYQDRFSRLLAETQSRSSRSRSSDGATWSPPVDIYETDQSVVLKAELPGVDAKDVEARIEDGTLYLKGQRKFESEVKEGSYHRIERSYGSFVRSFSLPPGVDSDKVAAEYKDGLLTLTLPKCQEAKPRTIQINVSKN